MCQGVGAAALIARADRRHVKRVLVGWVLRQYGPGDPRGGSEVACLNGFLCVPKGEVRIGRGGHGVACNSSQNENSALNLSGRCVCIK